MSTRLDQLKQAQEKLLEVVKVLSALGYYMDDDSVMSYLDDAMSCVAFDIHEIEAQREEADDSREARLAKLGADIGDDDQSLEYFQRYFAGDR